MGTRSGFSQLPSIPFDRHSWPPWGRFVRDQESMKSRNEDLAYLKRRVVYVQTWAWDKDKVRWNRDNSVFLRKVCKEATAKLAKAGNTGLGVFGCLLGAFIVDANRCEVKLFLAGRRYPLSPYRGSPSHEVAG